MINTAHIGNEVNEFSYEISNILEEDEKIARLNVLLEAIKNFNGGAKQARNLEDISPKFVIIAEQKTGNPFLLNTLSVDSDGNINIENIKEAIEDNQVERLTIGISKGIFNNEDEVKSAFENVTTVNKAIEEYKDMLKSK